jgi:outer membrane protein assembly factor BamB
LTLTNNQNHEKILSYLFSPYFINKSGNIFAYHLKERKLLWSSKLDDSAFRSPAISNGVATLITTNGHIYAFNIKNGNVLWKTTRPGKGYTNTSIAGNIVYVGCADGYLCAFDLNTGEELWKFNSGMPVNTPLIDNGTIYFTSGNYLYALN